jgi:hypothetical protein
VNNRLKQAGKIRRKKITVAARRAGQERENGRSASQSPLDSSDELIAASNSEAAHRQAHNM